MEKRRKRVLTVLGIVLLWFFVIPLAIPSVYYFAKPSIRTSDSTQGDNGVQIGAKWCEWSQGAYRCGHFGLNTSQHKFDVLSIQVWKGESRSVLQATRLLWLRDSILPVLGVHISMAYSGGSTEEEDYVEGRAAIWKYLAVSLGCFLALMILTEATILYRERVG